MMVMKKTLTATWLKILLFICGFVFALALFRHLSVTVMVAARLFWGDFLTIPAVIAASGLVIVLLLLFVSVWSSQQFQRKDALRQLDLGFLVFLIFFGGFIAYNVIQSYHLGGTGTVVAACAFNYVLSLGSFLELLSRIRDRDFHFYWRDFFRLYGWRTPIGAAMRLLLTENLLYFLLSVIMWYYYSRSMSGILIDMFAFGYRVLNNFYLSFILALALFCLTVFVKFSLHLAEDVAEANDEKIRAERFKAELITNVSHDMKTPLTSIINYVDLLKKLPVENQEFTEYTDVLERKSQRLKILIADLLEASKASTGAIEMNLQPLDLKEFLGQMAGEFVEDFAAKKLELIYRPSNADIKVIADSEHLQRVMENLLGNAVKYSLAGTRVFVELSSDEGQAAVSLANISKMPIEPGSEDLTEQFIRGDKARQSEGNGLGLYIAKNLTELMGGKLSIEITGDCFEVDLFIPLAADTKEISEK